MSIRYPTVLAVLSLWSTPALACVYSGSPRAYVDCIADLAMDNASAFAAVLMPGGAGNTFTGGVEGTLQTCGQFDSSSPGCNIDEGWPVKYHRSNSDMATNDSKDLFTSFLAPAAYWHGPDHGWRSIGRASAAGNCEHGVVFFTPVDADGPATPTRLHRCDVGDNVSAGCRRLEDGWPVVCVRADGDENEQKGGFMVEDAHWDGGQWLGIQRGPAGACTHGVWFWDF